MKEADTKTCGKCLRSLGISGFYRSPIHRTKVSWWCIDCQKSYQHSDHYREKARNHSITKYGITLTEHGKLVKNQGGACAGCFRRPSGKRRLDIDHRHQPGEKHLEPSQRRQMVRGLLCHMCNRALSYVRDNPETLRTLAGYLDSPPARKVIHAIRARVGRHTDKTSVHSAPVRSGAVEKVVRVKNSS